MLVNATADDKIAGKPFESTEHRALELLLCARGEVQFESPDRKLALSLGQSLLVGAGASNYRLSGEGRLYVAMIGDLTGIEIDDELPWERAARAEQPEEKSAAADSCP